MFDGKTLEGWAVKCLPKDKELAAKAWTVDHGMILANTIGHTEHFYIMLVSQKEYKDFVLRLRVQIERGTTGNSGIQIRSRYNDQTGWMEGPQIDINPPGPEDTGSSGTKAPVRIAGCRTIRSRGSSSTMLTKAKVGTRWRSVPAARELSPCSTA